MINLLINILYHISSWAIIFLALSLLIANIYPLLSKMLAKVNLEHAAFYILIYGLLAPIGACASLIVLSLPEFAFSVVADHCHGLDCTPHGLQVTLSSIYGVVKVTSLVALVVFILAMITLQLRSNKNKHELLNRLSEPTASSYKIVDSKAVLAWCSGLMKPQIFISRGLADSLSEEQMQVVLAHEQTHVVRKDNLRKWLLHWATIAWPTRLKKEIRKDLLEYTEQICDLVALKRQNKPNGLSVVIDTLKKCYSHVDQNNSVNSTNSCSLRTATLEKAWRTNGNGRDISFFTNSVPTVFIAGLLLATVLLTVRIGHPILEWLAI